MSSVRAEDSELLRRCHRIAKQLAGFFSPTKVGFSMFLDECCWFLENAHETRGQGEHYSPLREAFATFHKESLRIFLIAEAVY